MFAGICIGKDRPAYLQISDHIKKLISSGALQSNQKLPSSRELCKLLNICRNTVIAAYEKLAEEGLVYILGNKGVFVADIHTAGMESWNIEWAKRVSNQAQMAERLDLMKHGITAEKEMISFTSIMPDESLFDMENVKKAFLYRMQLEGEKILNYGYAKGYRPLSQYLLRYMESKGASLDGKDILITNGFTEGFDITLSALTERGSTIVCENPTHNTAIKIMKLHGLKIAGVRMEADGLDLNELEKLSAGSDACLAYLVPSYHNPTGIVMSPEKRIKALEILKRYGIPVVEDGFNEELRYAASHISPLIACSGRGNSVIYIGSFSKILFPGMRVGWILADESLIGFMESVKRSRSIHTSTLDQAILYQYLQDGNFEKYIKRARKTYSEKFNLALDCSRTFIPHRKISGEGGLHIFIELEKHLNARNVLRECMNRKVAFTPGDIFFTDNTGKNTLRLGFSRVSSEDIVKGIKIIGSVIRAMEVSQ